MNILLLIPELGKGGAERSISKLSMELSLEHKVHMVTFNNDYEKVYPTASDPVILGLKSKTSIGKLLNWRKRIKALKRFKKLNNIDVSISFLEGANYLNVLTKVNDKLILSIRGSKIYDKKISGFSGWVRKKILIPRLYPKADRIICVSNAIADEMRSYFKVSDSKITVIHNFYDIDRIAKDSMEEIPSQHLELFNKKTLMFIGRLDVQKEPLGLIKVFSEVKKQIDCRLIMMGEGELKQEMIHYGRSLGLSINEKISSDVVLLGYQTNPFQYVRKSNLFILSSSWEGFPNALSEALICKTAVISTDCPTGPRELLDAAIKSPEPILEPLLTKYGRLMPLLNSADEKIIGYWVDKIKEDLNRDLSKQTAMAFERMTHFKTDYILDKWHKVISSV